MADERLLTYLTASEMKRRINRKCCKQIQKRTIWQKHPHSGNSYVRNIVQKCDRFPSSHEKWLLKRFGQNVIDMKMGTRTWHIIIFWTRCRYRFSAFWLRSKCSICSYQLNIWYALHWSGFDIKLIFEHRWEVRGLLRSRHGLARYCSTSEIGPLNKTTILLIW